MKHRSEADLLKSAKTEITSLKDVEDLKKSSRELMKFKCEKCGKKTAMMVVNLKGKSKLICKSCEDKATKIENFGDSNYNNGSKCRKTCLERYGVEYTHQSEEIRRKVQETNLERYGSPWVTGSKHFDEKSRATCLKKYGVERVTQDKNFIESSLKKRWERYGDVSFNRKYFFEGTWFDSSWELAYYIWLRDTNQNFEFHPDSLGTYTGDDGKEHKYYPDFKVDGEYQEIKGSQFFNEKGEPFDMYTKSYWWKKHEFLKRNGVRIIRFDDFKVILKYIAKKYGKNYLKSFKNAQRSSESSE